MINVIAAMNMDGVIGDKGKIPWHIPEDLQFFKHVTMGNTVIVGRKTWDSIPQGLPGRNVFVLSRDENYIPHHNGIGALKFDSYRAAITAWRSEDTKTDLFIAGGSSIYQEAFKTHLMINRIYMTLVNTWEQGDAEMPEIPGEWKRHTIESYYDGDSLWYERVILVPKEEI